MQIFSIRLNEETIENIDKAASEANVSRGLFIRRTLESMFDGKPHHPLGLQASPKFYKRVCDVIAALKVLGLTFDDDGQQLIEMHSDLLFNELDINYVD